MNYSNIDSLEKQGFEGFQTISSLMQDDSCIPKSPGVYLVIRSKCTEPSFLAVGSGGHFKNKNPNVLIDVLKENWVQNALILYVGKAGGRTNKATLHSRIHQYLRFGQGYNVGHWGGRFIWQLQDAEDLLICWKTIVEQEPRKVEKEILSQFIEQFSKLPFANRTK